MANKYTISEDFMSILELQDTMSQQVRKMMSKDLTAEQREVVNAESRFLIGFSNQMINAANFTLNAEKVLAENDDLDKSVLKTYVYGVSE